ncbi:MAG: hypothetical protein F6K19_30235 [Cyanothece sp. SIO1E1]|nr:hypothetical protein [Cyanothece sp. SIO1E1]
MSDQDYLKLIEQGVESWNRWRQEHPDVTPNLSHAYLFQINLSMANLRDVNLHRACLIGADLRMADLRDADLSNAYASEADLTQANLTAADLRGANFSQANFTDADLSKTQAAATNFAAAQLARACLKDWHISNATNFSEAAEGDGVVPAQPEAVGAILQPPDLPVDRDELPSERSILVKPATEDVVADQQPFAQIQGNSLPAPAEGASVKGMPQAASALAQCLGMLRLQQRSGKIIAGTSAAIVVIAAIAHFTKPQPQTTQQPQTLSTPVALQSLPCNPPPLIPEIPLASPDHQYDDGTRYYGKFVDGVPADGSGMMVFRNGDRHDGEYRDGKRHGCGRFTFVNLRDYVGEFRSDQFHGQGVWTLENGDRYIGEFRNNKCNGQGTFIFADGSSRSGTWLNGNLVGATLSCNRGMEIEPEATAQ